MIYRYLFVLALALLCCACNSSTGPQADSEFREVKSFNRGETIVVPAPLGTSDSILGMAYDADLNDKDSNGVRHRMYPHVVSNSTERLYRSSYTLLETRTELNASANVLFASGGVTRIKSMRYAVLRVEYINRVLTLQPQGSPLYPGRLFASKIYYGWTLYYVFEGDSTQLNAHIAANFMSLVRGGVSLTSEVNRLGLRTYIVARGLAPKKQNDVVVALDADDITRNFTTSGSGNQPIAIEYECTSNFTVPAFNVEAPKYTPGNFTLDSLGFSIAETQADGSSWDTGSDPPDPIVKLYLNNVEIYSTQIDDVLSDTIGINRRITIGSNDKVNVVLLDEDDLSDNDFIGDFWLMGSIVFNKYHLRDPVPMDPTSKGGQIRNVTLFISPVR